MIDASKCESVSMYSTSYTPLGDVKPATQV